jgi:hypothetical protein
MADFGEGFWVTLLITTLWACVIGIAIAFNNETAKGMVTPMMGLLMLVVGFWFPTRGQTAQP